MKNLRHQIKSQWYYMFWGSMAVAVVGGQIYVGTGYREMAEATKSTAISVNCEIPVIPYSKHTSQAANPNRSFEFE